MKKVNKEALSPDQVDEEALAAFKREQVKNILYNNRFVKLSQPNEMENFLSLDLEVLDSK